MFRQMLNRIGVLALVGVGLLFVAGSANAQQGWPLQGSNWSNYFGASRPSNSGSYSPNYAPAYVNPMPPRTAYYSPAGSQSNYGLPATIQASTKSPARIKLQVPADAKIWFDESQTTQTGALRSFESPPLPDGRDYSYEVRIQWKRDGKDVSEDRKIIVHAGEVINLTLGVSPGSPLAQR
jgi:uncharacterized protein (TIGR03000 family)